MTDGEESELIASTMPTVDVYTDGGMRGHLGCGGYGAIACYNGQHNFYFGGFPDVSNNEMELYAILAVLRSLTVPCIVHIVSDSQYAVKAINGWINTWAMNGWKKGDGKPVMNQPMMAELFQFMQVHRIYAEWRRGHSHSNTPNTLCDHFATIGMYKAAHMQVPGRLIVAGKA